MFISQPCVPNQKVDGSIRQEKLQNITENSTKNIHIPVSSVLNDMMPHLVSVVIDSLTSEVPHAVREGNALSVDGPVCDVDAICDCFCLLHHRLVCTAYQGSHQTAE